MKLQKLIVLAIVLVAGINFTGCSVKKTQTAGKQNVSAGTNQSSEAKKASPAPSFSVAGIKPIAVDTSSKEGVYLSGYIESLTLSSGVELTGYTVGTPKWGSITALPNGHFRYYAPANICNDEVEVELRTNKGTKKVIIPIQVFKDTPSTAPPVSDTKQGPSSTDHKSAIITYPATGRQQVGRICEISGKVTGYSDNDVALAYVKDPWGNSYLQPSVIRFADGGFSTTVFLGDQYGHGVGDTFRIWIKMPDGRCSPCIKVKRIS
ncbi:MAG: hypothetical protein Q7S37_02075 [bacterium]|nr:hypothetical protein [bacterium]